MTLTPLSINTASSCWIFLREFVPMLFVLPGWGVCSSPCSHREILWSHWLSITAKQIFTELIYGCCKWQNLELLQTSFDIVSGIFSSLSEGLSLEQKVRGTNWTLYLCSAALLEVIPCLLQFPARKDVELGAAAWVSFLWSHFRNWHGALPCHGSLRSWGNI